MLNEAKENIQKSIPCDFFYSKNQKIRKGKSKVYFTSRRPFG